jgi:hypothetical protein
MNISDYTFQMGELAIIHEGKAKQLSIDLLPDPDGQRDPEIIDEVEDTTIDGEPILVEPNDLILLPMVMLTLKIAPKRTIGKPFQLPGFLIKFPKSIVSEFGVKYILYKLTIETHRLLLETDRFAFNTVFTLEHISKMKLSLFEDEAKIVNANATIYMNQIEQATAKAIFAHKQAIEEWKAAMKVLMPNDQHWH